MNCNSFILTYRGFTIWIRTTGTLLRTSTSWSAAYQLCLNNIPLHQYVDAAGPHTSEKAAAAKAVRFAKIDVDTRLEAGNSSRAARIGTGRISTGWLLRIAESRHRRS